MSESLAVVFKYTSFFSFIFMQESEDIKKGLVSGSHMPPSGLVKKHTAAFSLVNK